MKMRKLLSSIVLFFFCTIACSGQENCTVSVSVNGSDISRCVNFSVCSTIVLLDLNFTLNSTIWVANKTNIAVIGREEITTIQCSDYVGWNFSSINILRISNIRLISCGFVNTSSFIRYSTAIFMLNCTTVSIMNVNVHNSNSNGLTLIDVAGTVTVINTSFTSNSNKSSLENGGSGMYIGIGSNNQDMHIESDYLIHNCTFANNAANISNKSLDCDNGTYSGIGWGGALGIRLIRNNVSNVKITINDSIITGNSAGWGGAIELVMCRTQKNSIEINNSKFMHNIATDYGGGGLDIEFSGAGSESNAVMIYNTEFINNTAPFGGAVAISTHFAYDQKNNTVVFNNCTMKGNFAFYGSAIDVYPAGIVDSWYEIPKVTLQDCVFESNYYKNAPISGNIYRVGEGVVMITGLSLSLNGQIHFSNNSGSCIYAISSEVRFENGANAMFLNNTADKGAGVALIGYSVIVVGQNVDIAFQNNHATDVGGAIYYHSIDKHIYVLNRRCFIQSLIPPTSNVTFHFINNTKNNHVENAIFSTANLSQCYTSYMSDNISLSKKSIKTNEIYFHKQKCQFHTRAFTYSTIDKWQWAFHCLLGYWQ